MDKTTEDYVSFETAKLLKEKGFKEMCDSLYGTAVMHNGKYIDEDEEYELEMAGKANEIKYVEGGMVYNFWYRNDKRVKHQYSRPTLQRAMKWLRINYKLNIAIIPTSQTELIKGKGFVRQYRSEIYNDNDILYTIEFVTGHEEACEAAIQYCLKNFVK